MEKEVLKNPCYLFFFRLFFVCAGDIYLTIPDPISNIRVTTHLNFFFLMPVRLCLFRSYLLVVLSCSNLCTHTHVRTYTHDTQMYCTHTHTHTHTCTHAHTHTHTHTHFCS